MNIKESYKRIYNQSLEKKTEKSIKLLKEVVKVKKPDIPLIVNFSGGKDSLVCLSLAMKVTDNVECCYADGGFELPLTLDYIKKRCEEFGVKLHIAKAGEVHLSHKILPDNIQTLQDFVLHYGYWPTAGTRWCSIWFKQRVMKAYWRSIYSKDIILYKLNGVRMFESNVRLWKYGNPKHYLKHCIKQHLFLSKYRKFIRYDREHLPCLLVYPILEYTDNDVMNYLNKENIKIHSGYKIFGVSGCKWCPVHSPDVYENILKVYPNIYDDIIEIEEKIGKPAVQNKFFLKDIKNKIISEQAGE